MAKDMQIRRELAGFKGSNSNNGDSVKTNPVREQNIRLSVFGSIISQMEKSGRHSDAYELCMEIHNMERALKNLVRVSPSAAEKFAMQHDLQIELAREFVNINRHNDALTLYLKYGRVDKALEIALKLENFNLASEICASSGDEIRALAYKRAAQILNKGADSNGHLRK